MKKSAFSGMAALGFLMVTSSSIYAQNPYGPGFLPNQRPAISPYLNLNRPGQSPGLNYYTLVRPEFTALNNFQSLQQQQILADQAITDVRASNTPPVTGHVPTFLNTGGYFLNRGGGGGGARGGLAIGGGFGAGRNPGATGYVPGGYTGSGVLPIGGGGYGGFGGIAPGGYSGGAYYGR
jgi:hypothetical protein